MIGRPRLVGGWVLSVLERHCEVRNVVGLAGFHLYRALDNDINACERDGVVLDAYVLLALH